MSVVSIARTFVRNIVRRQTVERELDDELRAYVDLLATGCWGRP
jgi:hypothetical protein